MSICIFVSFYDMYVKNVKNKIDFGTIPRIECLNLARLEKLQLLSSSDTVQAVLSGILIRWH